MTYIYKTVWSGSEIVAEYCYSSLDNCIKVVELTVDGKFHRTNWMGPNGRDKLMDELEADMTDRMCGTNDYSFADEVSMESYDSEIDLDRDIPSPDSFSC